MLSLRLPARAADTEKIIFALLAALLVSWIVAVPTFAQDDEAEALKQAIHLFEAGDYLAAQEILAGIDRDKLAGPQQRQRDDYLERVQVALRMSEKAIRDLEDAETAVEEGEYVAAHALLQNVLDNEYAPGAVRRKAEDDQRDLKERIAASRKEATTTEEHPVEETAGESGEHAMHHGPLTPKTPEPPPTPEEAVTAEETIGESVEHAVHEGPATPKKAEREITPADARRARVLTAEAEQMAQAGRYAEAERLFYQAQASVPGYPEAVEGLSRVRAHAENAFGTAGLSLSERIRRQDTINWQRTVAEYRDVDRLIRDRVLAERFDPANQLLIRARQIVESGRQFADPPVKYENLRSELDALAAHVRTAERLYNERKVAEVRRGIEDQTRKRQRKIEDNRARQVDSLMQQALQHRKDGDLKSAINVLRQITVIDPKFQPARWLMDSLDDLWQYQKERGYRDRQYGETRKVLLEAEKAKIPLSDDIGYPDDWIELINRSRRRKPGSQHNSQLWGALDRRISVDFNKEPFQQVIERLADANNLNVIVNWNDLKQVGVERNVPVELSLPREITLRKALTEVLEQVGGGVVDLGFEVADGAITVATQRFLDQHTYMAVHTINDLLVESPRFDEVSMTGLAGDTYRPFRRSERADLPWLYGDDDDDEAETDPRKARRVRAIIELIRNHVAPESWRERGGSIGTIDEINGQLVITQNAAAQSEIYDLLAKLREEAQIQIAVEAVFLTISSHYLEELGINVNLVLNSGNAGFDFVPGGEAPMIDPILGNRLLLPRTFSRLGFTPATPAMGNALGARTGLTPVPQPLGQPFLIPPATGGGGSQSTPIPIINNLLSFTDPRTLGSDVPGTFAGQNIPPALSVFGSFLDNIQVDFLIRATQADSRSTVLTAPRVVVMNGGNAVVTVSVNTRFIGTLVAIVAQEAAAVQPVPDVAASGATLNIFNATVTADRRYVKMSLNPSVSRLLDMATIPASGGTLAAPSFVQTPTTEIQMVATSVFVPDGGTLLIGGQKMVSEIEVEAGVPILSKIPLLKRLYSSRTMIKDEQMLLILIKPKILILPEQEELAFPSFGSR